MRKCFWLISAGVMAIATPAAAQDVSDAGSANATAQAGAVDEAEDLEDMEAIVITAQGRQQALQDVPLAVTAINAESLQNSGASDIRQLNQLSPSLLVSSSSTEAGAGSARIRGIGTVGDNAGLESSVATFIDGVYRSRAGVALTELGPIERIEVLRGPQGTLFGRNASAGLIHVITARPRFETEGYAELSYGNYDHQRLAAGITGGLSETVAARFDGIYAKRDGFVEDVVSGRDVNNRDRLLARGQLLLRPNDAMSLRLIADYAYRDEECCTGPYREPTDPSAVAVLGLLNGLGAQIQSDTFDRKVSITPGRSFRSDVRDWGVSGEFNYDFGNVSLTSITAYRDWYWVRGQDADFNALDILARDDRGGADQGFDTFTQELRLQGEAFGGRLDWLVGGYYANETLRVNDNLGPGSQYGLFQSCQVALNLTPLTGFAPSPTSPRCLNPMLDAGLGAGAGALGQLGPVVRGALTRLASLNGAGGFPSNDSYEQKSRNFALFTHNVVEVADNLNLTLGLRYTNERKRLDVDFNANPTAATICGQQVAALQPVLAGLPAGQARTLLGTILQLTCVFPPINGDFEDEKKEDEFSGTAVLSYKPVDDLLTYASYSRGYKAGGFNLDRQGLQLGATSISGLRFEPETVDAFEVGAKYDGRGFDLNVAGFYQKFNNFQLNSFNGTAFIVENITGCSELAGGSGSDSDNDSATGACTGDEKAGVTSKGVEVELFTRPTRDTNVNVGVTYADTKYNDDLSGFEGRPLTAALFQLPGRRISNSSEWVVTGSAGWNPSLGSSGLSGLLYADFRYQTELNTGSDLDLEKVQGDFFVVNARVGVRGPDEAWSLEFWAQNLLDEDYLQVGFDAPLQGSGATRGVQQGFYGSSSALYGAFLAEPRTYGVTLRSRF